MPRKATGETNGRPSFEPTVKETETVRLMAAAGIPHKDICLCLRDGIDINTLKKHFGPVLDTALTKANANVTGAMYKKAMAGDVGAQRYWLGCRAGWKETSVQEHESRIYIYENEKDV